MSLFKIFQAVSERIPNVHHRFGAPTPYNEDGSRRIAWSPQQEVISAARGMGGDGVSGQMFPIASLPLRTREVQVDVHIWGRSFDDAESLLTDFVRVAYDLLTDHSVDFTAGQWLNNDGQTFAHGAVYVLSMTVRIPIVRAEPVRIKPTQMGITPVLDILDGTPTTEPEVIG